HDHGAGAAGRGDGGRAVPPARGVSGGLISKGRRQGGGVTSTPTAGARPDEVRRHNRTVLLRRLHVDGPTTRASLATELGLNRSTIKALVDGLAESGVVEERVPRLRSGAGRPSLLVLPQPHAAVVLAVDVRVEGVAIALVGLGGEMLGRNSWNLHGRGRHPEEVITHIVESTAWLAGDVGVDMVYVGELGHMVVRPNGRPCYCGSHGCWETEVGEPALCRALDLPEGSPRGAVVAELRAMTKRPATFSGPLGEFLNWLTIGLINIVN